MNEMKHKNYSYLIEWSEPIVTLMHVWVRTLTRQPPPPQVFETVRDDNSRWNK